MIRAMPERKRFFSVDVFPYKTHIAHSNQSVAASLDFVYYSVVSFISYLQISPTLIQELVQMDLSVCLVTIFVHKCASRVWIPDQSQIICSCDRSNPAVISFPFPANPKKREAKRSGVAGKQGGATGDGAVSKQTVSPLPRSRQLFLHLPLQLSRHTGLFSIPHILFLMHSPPV